MTIYTIQGHTAGSDTIFVQINMDPPPGVLGVSKDAPERHKLQNIIKIGKKCQKSPVFLDIFEYSSIWGQY